MSAEQSSSSIEYRKIVLFSVLTLSSLASSKHHDLYSRPNMKDAAGYNDT